MINIISACSGIKNRMRIEPFSTKKGRQLGLEPFSTKNTKKTERDGPFLTKNTKNRMEQNGK